MPFDVQLTHARTRPPSVVPVAAIHSKFCLPSATLRKQQCQKGSVLLCVMGLQGVPPCHGFGMLAAREKEGGTGSLLPYVRDAA